MASLKSGVKFILQPINWIIENIAFDGIVLYRIADNVVMKPRLPRKIGMDDMCLNCNRRFESSNNR
jgi:hypothetical protein